MELEGRLSRPSRRNIVQLGLEVGERKQMPILKLNHAQGVGVKILSLSPSL